LLQGEPKRQEVPVKRLILLGVAMIMGGCQLRTPPERLASIAQYRGHSYAQASCSSCHAIGPGSNSSPNPQAPPFASIANSEGLSRQTLNAWLRNTHNYPGEMTLRIDESKLDDLVTYMLALKNPNYRPVG
jgi:mono/diheme cytochrome c family protein